MQLRPLFGSKCSVQNVHDGFGDVVNKAKDSESKGSSASQADGANQDVSHLAGELPTTSKGETLPEPSSESIRSTREQIDRHHSQDNELGGLLAGAALMAPKNDHSHPDDHDHDTDVEPEANPASDSSDTAVHETDTDTEANAARREHGRAMWKQAGDEANAADKAQSNKKSTRLGKTLKKVDARIRSTLGVFPAPSANEKKSPYSVGSEDYAGSHLSIGAAELLNEASLDHLADLYSDEDDSDDTDDELDVDDVAEPDSEQRSSSTERMRKSKAKLEKSERRARKARTDSNDVEAGDSVKIAPEISISLEEKLKSIIEEFGECPSVSAPDVPEEVIADIPAVLIKTVMIKGSLFLTNRRLCFLAFIPVAKGDSPAHSDSVQAPVDPNVENPILKSGPAILHRAGKMRPKRHVWLELRKKSITAYPSSNKLYKPIGSTQLAGLETILPTDWSQPNVIKFIEGSRYSSLEFKTQEAALDWRKELEGAAFHAHNTSEKVRISLPLDRVVNVDANTFLQFAQIVHVDVLDSRYDGMNAAEERHQMQHSWSTGHTVVDCPKNPGFQCHITKVAFGITISRLAFIDLIKEALVEPNKTRKSKGDQELLRKSPPPLLDIEGEKDNESSDHAADPDDANMPLAERFCHRFGLKIKPDELKLVKAELVRSLPTHGTMAIGLDYLCFWRRAVGRDLKIKVPLNDVRGVETYRSILWHHFGLVVHITAHPDMFFDFMSKANRDTVLETLKEIISAKDQPKKDTDHSQPTDDTETQAKEKKDASNHPLTAAHAVLQNARNDVPVFDANSINLLPKLVNVDNKVMRDALRISPMRIYCLTIGSRGDVQPYIALCKALKAHGHTTVIVSHPEYRSWVEGHGIEYRGVGGDPAALMKLSVEHKMFSPAFFRESIGKFRVWLDELLRECWEECQGAELLIESPSTMAGIHVAEGLGIPYFRAFTMPWTKTSAYPQAFSVPAIDMGASYNSSSYVLFDQIMWVATSGQINRWRKHMIGIGPTDLAKLDSDSVPFIYNFSPAVVPVPNDWGDRVKVSGYWFLDNPESDWKPPKEMEDFIAKARKDEKKIAYIGFGSITIDNAAEVSQNIMQAVKQADIRAIVAKGWSGRGESSKKKPKQAKRQNSHASQPHRVAYDEHEADESADEEENAEPEIPEEVFVVDSVPHDWLFPQIDIAMHHGGAGTTRASLRAGLVTLIKPFFGDQMFWSLRVQKLGAGARVHSLSTSDLTDALKSAAQDRIMVEKAQGVGEKIRSENGVSDAIQFLYSNISLAERRGHRRVDKEASREASFLASHAPTASASASSTISTLTNPFARLTGRSHAGDGPESSDGEGEKPTRSSTTPAGGKGVGSFFSKQPTVTESPLSEDAEAASEKHEEKRSSTFFSMPSMPNMPSLPHTNLTSAFKEALTLHTSSTDTTEDGEEIARSPTSPSGHPGATSPPAEGESNDAKMARLKGYKNAKAEDIRRRKLLQEKLAQQGQEPKQQLKRGSSHGSSITKTSTTTSST